MLLAIDIGNTTIALGLFEGGRLRVSRRLKTHPLRPARLARELHGLLRAQRRKPNAVRKALLCSVVPPATPMVVAAVRKVLKQRVRIVGRDLRVPLKNRYRYPRQVGQDRLVGAYAAWRRYRRACIVADFGTAITIDVVTGKGEYLGGVIAPGLEISLDALAARTALLPKVELREPPELLGRDTASSIRSGILFGCIALCDGLITQLKRRYAPKALVVATGGASPLIARHAAAIDRVRPHLVLEGLDRLIHEIK